MPPEYGIRLTNLNGKKTIIRPEHTTVIASGTVAMPSGLNGDGTYGVDIDLPYSNISVDDLGVIVVPHSPNKNVIYTRYLDDSSNVIYTTHYVDSGYNYYNRNDSNGVMTSWSPGNRTANVKSTWNPILGCYPIAFWDKMGATTFSKVRLFGATAYLVRDTIDDTNLALLGIASNVDGLAFWGGSISSVIDNAIITYPPVAGIGWGQFSYINGWSGNEWKSCVITVDLDSPRTITQIDINYLVNTRFLTSGDEADASCMVAICVNGAWYDMLSISQSGSVGASATTNSVYGWWRNVSKIRASITCHTQLNGHHNSATIAEFYVGELRAWGSNDTDADENKLIYSIGSSQLVDYLVTMRKYNY
jgi:hypothetical protein